MRPHEELVARLAERLDGYRLPGVFHCVFWLFVPDRGLTQTLMSPHEHLAQLGAFQHHPLSLLTHQERPSRDLVSHMCPSPSLSQFVSRSALSARSMASLAASTSIQTSAG